MKTYLPLFLFICSAFTMAHAAPYFIDPVESKLDCHLTYGDFERIDLVFSYNGNEAGMMGAGGSLRGMKIEMTYSTQGNPEVGGVLWLPGYKGRKYMVPFGKKVSNINRDEYLSRVLLHITDNDRSGEIYVNCDRKTGK